MVTNPMLTEMFLSMVASGRLQPFGAFELARLDTKFGGAAGLAALTASLAIVGACAVR